jgi:class 3 adenylate cyclase
MFSSAEVGKIQISTATRALLPDGQIALEERGEIQVKG